MPNLSSSRGKYCEVLRVSYKRDIPKSHQIRPMRHGDSLFKSHEVELVYRSDGVVLEKHIVMYAQPFKDWGEYYGDTITGHNFGWRVLGPAKETPAEFVKKYKAKGWTVKIKPAKVMSKYISKNKIRRLTNGL